MQRRKKGKENEEEKEMLLFEWKFQSSGCTIWKSYCRSRVSKINLKPFFIVSKSEKKKKVQEHKPLNF